MKECQGWNTRTPYIKNRTDSNKQLPKAHYNPLKQLLNNSTSANEFKELTSSITNKNPCFSRSIASSLMGAKSPSMLNKLYLNRTHCQTPIFTFSVRIKEIILDVINIGHREKISHKEHWVL